MPPRAPKPAPPTPDEIAAERVITETVIAMLRAALADAKANAAEPKEQAAA